MVLLLVGTALAGVVTAKSSDGHAPPPGGRETFRLGAGDFGAVGKLEPFWSTQPLGAHITPPTSSVATQNNSALECARPPLGRCMFGSDDEWLASVLPMWPKSKRDTSVRNADMFTPNGWASVRNANLGIRLKRNR